MTPEEVHALASRLQWGHDLAVMERGKGILSVELTGPQLQWGHDLAVMERARIALGPVPDHVASMGP